jgi:hypothetical protein
MIRFSPGSYAVLDNVFVAGIAAKVHKLLRCEKAARLSLSARLSCYI